MFNLLSFLFVAYHQPVCRAVICLPDDQFSSIRVVCLFDKNPYFARWIAKARKGTEILHVTQNQCRPVKFFGVPSIWCTVRRLSSFESNFIVCPIAEGFVLRTSAPTERIFRFSVESLAAYPIPRKAFLVGRDGLCL